MTLVENWDTSPSEDSSSLEDYESTVEEVERLSTPTILPNYLNNLTFAFNINNRLNAFETSLWKLYQHHSPPSLLAITNLWTQLQDHDAEANAKRKEFEAVQRKANAEVQRRLGPKINPQRNPPFITKSPESEARELDSLFWKQFLGFKTEGRDTDLTRPATSPPLNPFYNRFYLSTYDKVKLCLMSVVFVVRIVLILLILMFASLLCMIGTFAIDQQNPLSIWRRALRWFVGHVVMRTVWFIAGFHWVRTIGKRATSREAQVLIAAPHSSYFDSFVVTYLGGPSVVAKEDAKKLPFFGSLIDFTQPIYVNRDDPTSRTRCVQEIRRRVQSKVEWPQVFVFPEGTCTNRSCLAQFKAGAFLAGVPVQPIAVRYPNRLDCVTWTFDGPSGYWSAFVALTQFHNSIEIEFLPVYTPSEEEQHDAVLYATNIQRVVAEALGVPATEFTYDDGKVLSKMSRTKLRKKLQTIWKIKGDLNLREAATETTLVYEGTTKANYEWRVRLEQFKEIFHVNGETPLEVQELFNLFVQGGADTIDLRAYLLLACFLYSDAHLDLLVTLMFKMYAGTRPGIRREEFLELMKNLFEASEKEGNEVFDAHSQEENRTVIPFNEFQRKMKRRVEFLKLYSMEETGQRSGNFPLRSQRDQNPKRKLE